jgi:hypothetical protein
MINKHSIMICEQPKNPANKCTSVHVHNTNFLACHRQSHAYQHGKIVKTLGKIRKLKQGEVLHVISG